MKHVRHLSCRWIALLPIAAIPTLSGAQTAAWRALPALESGPGVESLAVMLYDPGAKHVVHLGLSDAWEWNGSIWCRAGALPFHFSFGYDGVACFDVAGDRSFSMDTFSGETWVSSGGVSTQLATAPLPVRLRDNSAIAYDSARSRVVLFGGRKANLLVTDTWEFDGATWLQGPAAPPSMVAREDHAMAFDALRGVTVLNGGTDAGSATLADTWEYGGAGWVQAPSAPGARSRHRLAFDPSRGVMFAFAASGSGPTLANDLWRYDGSVWTIAAAPPPAFEPRSGAAIACDAARGRLVIYGGYNGEDEGVVDTWETDGTQWTLALPGDATALERYLPALIYDSRRDRVVCFGGFPYQATWEFDGKRWVPGVPVPAQLDPRYFPAFCFDSVRGRSIVFGGADDLSMNGPHNDTWYYDGSAWTPGPAAPPALIPRTCHAMTFDSARAVAVMFGGDDGTGVSLNDTWELDANAWSPGPAAPAALTPRQYMALTYDAARQKTVLYGGDNQSAIFNDTWEYDGTAWIQGAASPAALTKRVQVAMEFDTVRAKVMIVGGNAQGNDTAQTWLYDGSAWTPGAPMPQGRSGHSMVWDSMRSRGLVFGGYTPNYDRTLLEYCGSCLAPEGSVAGQGPAAANAPRVRIHAPTGLPSPVDFLAYGTAGFGVNVSSGNIDGGALGEILTAPGPGAAYGPQIRGFRRDGTALPKVNFYAYGTLKYGARVAAGGLDADAPEEILTGPGPGPVFGPHVRAWNFDGGTLAAIARCSFYAYATLRYGVDDDGGDVDGTGDDEIATAPGPGIPFGPQVRAFDFDGTRVQAIAKINFSAFPTSQYGADVGSASVDADAFAELVASPGPGAALPCEFRGFNYDAASVSPMAGYDVTPFASLYGGRVGLGDVDADAVQELLAGAGPDPSADSCVLVERYDLQAMVPIQGRYEPFGESRYGVEVAGGAFGY
ncbi:MAG: hypothetical protein U0166_01470 [Acidobacteriota bacterium]